LGRAAPAISGRTLGWTYLFGALWGFGGLTFGLTMRYLGMSLGMGVALGYCAAFGTLLPPVFKLFFPASRWRNRSRRSRRRLPGKNHPAWGVRVSGRHCRGRVSPGLTKEREMPESEKKKAIAEFNFTKGILVATFSGIMSACFSFALTAGMRRSATASAAAGTSTLWTGLPKLVVVLLGGFTTNFIWCVMLNIKNHTGYQYLASQSGPSEHAGLVASGSEHGGEGCRVDADGSRSARCRGWGTTSFPRWRARRGTSSSSFTRWARRRWGEYGFASWTLHMASIIIFSTMWGWILP
jgi:L-rhamnose-H+ transport protein